MSAATVPFDVVFAHALQGEACTVRTPDGRSVPLPVEDWTRGADPVDRLFLRHCTGATIDVGCGPGRLTEELALAGHVVLGIDVVHEAVAQTRRRGGPALHRDVFDRVPGEGRWDTVLLADGNVGIGGDPAVLMRRMRDLLRRTGRIVVEVEPPGRPTGSATVQLRCQCASTGYFTWGRVGVDGLASLARRAGLAVRAVDQYDRRWCAVLGVDR